MIYLPSAAKQRIRFQATARIMQLIYKNNKIYYFLKFRRMLKTSCLKAHHPLASAQRNRCT